MTKNFTIKKQKSRKDVEYAISHTTQVNTRHLLNSRETFNKEKENLHTEVISNYQANLNNAIRHQNHPRSSFQRTKTLKGGLNESQDERQLLLTPQSPFISKGRVNRTQQSNDKYNMMTPDILERLPASPVDKWNSSIDYKRKKFEKSDQIVKNVIAIKTNTQKNSVSDLCNINQGCFSTTKKSKSSKLQGGPTMRTHESMEIQTPLKMPPINRGKKLPREVILVTNHFIK